MGFKEDIYSLVFEHNYGTWPIYRRFTYQTYSNMVIFHSEVFNFPEGMVGCWFFLVGHWSCSTNPSIINTLRTWTCKIKLGSFPDFPIPGPRVPRGCPGGAQLVLGRLGSGASQQRIRNYPVAWHPTAQLRSENSGEARCYHWLSCWWVGRRLGSQGCWRRSTRSKNLPYFIQKPSKPQWK